MNLRPSGYEPDELPDCSTPHRKNRPLYLVLSPMQVEQDHRAAVRRQPLLYCKAR